MKIEKSCDHCEWAGKCPREQMMETYADAIKNLYGKIAVMEFDTGFIKPALKLNCSYMLDNTPLELPAFMMRA